MQSFFKKISLKTKKGFSLPELMVSIAIVVIITAVVVYKQSDFADIVAVSNDASAMELAFREVQTYGISVKESQPNSGSFSSAYGISVNLNSYGAGNNNYTYVTFVDNNQSSKYNFNSGGYITCPGAGECSQVFSLTRNNVISDLCVINSSGSDVCYSGGASTNPGRLDIIFLRPNPDASVNVTGRNGNDVTSSYANYRGIKIKLQSPKGNVKTVVVYTTGQISVQ